MVTAHAGKDEGETETQQHEYWSGLIHSGLLKSNLALCFKHMHFHIIYFLYIVVVGFLCVSICNSGSCVTMLQFIISFLG